MSKAENKSGWFEQLSSADLQPEMNSIFDKGLSGIFETKTSKLPDFLEKLAEETESTQMTDTMPDDQVEICDSDTINFKPEDGTANAVIIVRAPELTSDDSREFEGMNVHSREKAKRLRFANDLQKIEKDFNTLLFEGKHPNEIQKVLEKKYPAPLVKQFLEASIQVQLDKYSVLGFPILKDDEDVKSLILSSKVNSLTKEVAKEIVNKFSKLNFIPKEVIAKVTKRLNWQDPVREVLTFVLSLDKIKKLAAKDANESKILSSIFSSEESQRKVAEENNLLKRTNDVSKSRELEQAKNNDNNLRKVFAKYEDMLNEYKEMLRKNASDIKIKIALKKRYGRRVFNNFYEKHIDEISKYAKFLNRKTVADSMIHLNNSTVSKDATIQNETKTLQEMKDYTISNLEKGKIFANVCTSLKNIFGSDLTKKFLIKNQQIEKKYGPYKLAFNLLTQGRNSNEIEEQLRKKFSNVSEFMQENEKSIQKHFGQLGYVFIDSNIYDNCDEMKNTFADLKHFGSSLISSVKSNSKCQECSCNEKGKCSKVNLMISNNPIVRSPRAAKKVFERATGLVPKSYIEKFASKIDNEGGNLKLVSEFNLGLRQASKEEEKNIGKTASKNRISNTEVQRTMQPTETDFNIDLFRKSNTSKIIDSIL
jgi:hypothetical protein